MSIPKCKKIFLFLPLDKRFRDAILYALTPKSCPGFVSSGKGHRFNIWGGGLFCCSENHLIIFLFSYLSIGLFKKNIFILPLDKAWKLLYNIRGLFLPGLFLSLSYRWSIKGRSSLEGRPFFISKSTNYSAFLALVNTQNLRKNILFFLLTTKENPL